jgi:HAD superfamily hydrolase (TIGR01509 family)
VIGHAWQEIFAELRVAERVGLDLPGMQAETERARRRMRDEGIHFRVLDGARELVTTLVELEIPTAIVSGSCRAEIAEALELLGFGHHLRMYLGAEDYPRGKPAPDGYMAAAEQLAIAPSRCLVFEDSEAGITSALAAGMRVVATAAANRAPGSAGYQDQRRAQCVVPTLAGIDHAFLIRMMANA